MAQSGKELLSFTWGPQASSSAVKVLSVARQLMPSLKMCVGAVQLNLTETQRRVGGLKRAGLLHESKEATGAGTSPGSWQVLQLVARRPGDWLSFLSPPPAGNRQVLRAQQGMNHHAHNSNSLCSLQVKKAGCVLARTIYKMKNTYQNISDISKVTSHSSKWF